MKERITVRALISHQGLHSVSVVSASAVSAAPTRFFLIPPILSNTDRGPVTATARGPAGDTGLARSLTDRVHPAWQAPPAPVRRRVEAPGPGGGRAAVAAAAAPSALRGVHWQEAVGADSADAARAAARSAARSAPVSATTRIPAFATRTARLQCPSEGGRDPHKDAAGTRIPRSIMIRVAVSESLLRWRGSLFGKKAGRSQGGRA
jgi:hypothetical protein